MEALIISLIAVIFGIVGWLSAPAEMAWAAHFGTAIMLALIAIAAAIDTK